MGGLGVRAAKLGDVFCSLVELLGNLLKLVHGRWGGGGFKSTSKNASGRSYRVQLARPPYPIHDASCLERRASAGVALMQEGKASLLLVASSGVFVFSCAHTTTTGFSLSLLGRFVLVVRNRMKFCNAHAAKALHSVVPYSSNRACSCNFKLWPRVRSRTALTPATCDTFGGFSIGAGWDLSRR